MELLLKTDFERQSAWRKAFGEVFANGTLYCWPEDLPPQHCRYALVWDPSAAVFKALPNLSLLFSIGAGVDHIDLSLVPAKVNIVRMVDPVLSEGMRDYIYANVIDFSRYFYRYADLQCKGAWQPIMQKANRDWRILIFGAGQLGLATATMLKANGFNVTAIGRSAREERGIRVLAGESALNDELVRADIVINVLPLTASTRHYFNHHLFARFKKGSAFINAGRGQHVDEAALRQALDGPLERAYLDVFQTEPLPQDAWQWSHPRVRLTPHIASMTYPATALQYVADQIERFERGEPLLHCVNKNEGY